jgi:hypothetical protein
MRIAWGLLAICLAGGPAWAAPEACPVPPELALDDIALPAARVAVATGGLVVMTMGGGASAGLAARGAGFTLSARLAARLRAGLPGVAISVISRAALRQTTANAERHLSDDLAQTGAKLVIWGAGGIEAGYGMDAERMAGELDQGIAKIRAAGADVILMDVQYAPSIARVIDLEPYRDTVRRVAAEDDVPLLDRYALMLEWSQDGVLDFDVTDPDARVQVARRLFDCLAAAIADGVIAAVRPGLASVIRH